MSCGQDEGHADSAERQADFASSVAADRYPECDARGYRPSDTGSEDAVITWAAGQSFNGQPSDDQEAGTSVLNDQPSDVQPFNGQLSDDQGTSTPAFHPEADAQPEQELNLGSDLDARSDSGRGASHEQAARPSTLLRQLHKSDIDDQFERPLTPMYLRPDRTSTSHGLRTSVSWSEAAVAASRGALRNDRRTALPAFPWRHSNESLSEPNSGTVASDAQSQPQQERHGSTDSTASQISTSSSQLQAARHQAAAAGKAHTAGLYNGALKLWRAALGALPEGALSEQGVLLGNAGVTLARLGRYQEAGRSLEAALKARPSAAVAFNLSLCAFAGGEPEATRRAFTILLQVPAGGLSDRGACHDRDSCRSIKGVAGVGSCKGAAYQPGSYEQWCSFSLTAARLLAASLGGGNAEAGFLWCAAAAHAAGRPALAVRINLAAAAAQLSAGQLSTAVISLQEIAGNEDDAGAAASANASLAALAFEVGDVQLAAQLADYALSQTGSSPPWSSAAFSSCVAHVAVAACALVGGNTSAALNHSRVALRTDPNCCEASYNHGLAARASKLLDQAQRSFRRCAAVRPSDTGTLIQLAACREDLGDVAGAAADVAAVVEMAELTGDPESSAELLLMLATLRARLGSDAGAIEAAQRAQHAVPGAAAAPGWLAAFSAVRGRHVDASHWLDIAAEAELEELTWQLAAAGALAASLAPEQVEAAAMRYGAIASQHGSCEEAVHQSAALASLDPEAKPALEQPHTTKHRVRSGAKQTCPSAWPVPAGHPGAHLPTAYAQLLAWATFVFKPAVNAGDRGAGWDDNGFSSSEEEDDVSV